MTPILRSLIVCRQYQRQPELIPCLQRLLQDARPQIHPQQMAVFRRPLQTSSSSPTASSDDQRPPDLPTTCCMSGCANCVWLDYAEEIVKFYEERGSKANLDRLLDEIDRNVSDEMVKAFVKMEIKSKFLFGTR